MNNILITNAVRFVVFVFLQVLVFKRISIGSGEWSSYVNLIVYPIFIILLPLRTPHFLMVLLGFLIGITIDSFYDSPGVHASACVFIGFIRPVILAAMAPQGGYNMSYSPTKARFGNTWFIIYASIMLFLHLFFYFSVEAFTFWLIDDIFLKTLFTFFISMIFIIIYQFSLNPLE